jgi:glycosyltransferase involved in cell wall biosynthesis
MKLTVSLEVRFDQLPDGSVWTLTNYTESFWHRYLTVFDEVIIVARCRQIKELEPGLKRVDGERRIKFFPLPFYIGPYQYIRKRNSLKRRLNEVLSISDAFLFRIGSPIADILIGYLRDSGYPFGVEVVGDPYDTFAPGSNDSVFRFFFRWWFSRKLKWETRYADVASYVTSVRLPDRYPAQSAKKVIFASSIELLPHQLRQGPRNYQAKSVFKLISVGALEDWRKGQDLAFKCLKELISLGYDVRLTWIGDGRARGDSERLANELGITDRIEMRGQLPSGDAIFSALDEADIFIMPTRGEGLPRAVIEAMARGLPVVASDVGGIPELLSEQFLHKSGDVSGMTRIISDLITTPESLSKASWDNLEKAKNYLESHLSERRTELYKTLWTITHEWKKNRSNR